MSSVVCRCRVELSRVWRLCMRAMEVPSPNKSRPEKLLSHSFRVFQLYSDAFRWHNELILNFPTKTKRSTHSNAHLRSHRHRLRHLSYFASAISIANRACWAKVPWLILLLCERRRTAFALFSSVPRAMLSVRHSLRRTRENYVKKIGERFNGPKSHRCHARGWVAVESTLFFLPFRWTHRAIVRPTFCWADQMIPGREGEREQRIRLCGCRCRCDKMEYIFPKKPFSIS